MSVLETAAYSLALVSVVAFPPAFAIWFVIHPFVRQWRVLGPAGTWLILGPVLVGAMGALYAFREPLLSVHFDVHPVLIAAAALSMGGAVFMITQRAPYLTPGIRMGVPELSRDERGELLTEGIYARIRHPTYVEGGLALAACALFSNYLAVWILLVAYLPIIYAIVALEERELEDRFGPAWVEYASRVPRFVPKPRRRREPG